MPNTIRVYPDGDVWVVKKDANARASAICNTQREAYETAREIALNQGLSVTVHGPDGKIQKVIYPQDRSSGGSGDGCFITTACIQSKNLSDDCYELQILRRFRDEFVLHLPQGKSFINKYYEIAPRIVLEIDRNSQRKRIYNSLFRKIQCACKLIEDKKFENAFLLYSSTVRELSLRFKIK